MELFDSAGKNGSENQFTKLRNDSLLTSNLENDVIKDPIWFICLKTDFAQVGLVQVLGSIGQKPFSKLFLPYSHDLG